MTSPDESQDAPGREAEPLLGDAPREIPTDGSTGRSFFPAVDLRGTLQGWLTRLRN